MHEHPRLVVDKHERGRPPRVTQRLDCGRDARDRHLPLQVRLACGDVEVAIMLHALAAEIDQVGVGIPRSRLLREPEHAFVHDVHLGTQFSPVFRIAQQARHLLGRLCRAQPGHLAVDGLIKWGLMPASATHP